MIGLNWQIEDVKKPVRKHGRFRKQHGTQKGEVIMNDKTSQVNRLLAHFNGGGTVTSFVSTHSRPKAAGASAKASARKRAVSTHSRPKAAGTTAFKKGSK